MFVQKNKCEEIIAETFPNVVKTHKFADLKS